MGKIGPEMALKDTWNKLGLIRLFELRHSSPVDWSIRTVHVFLRAASEKHDN